MLAGISWLDVSSVPGSSDVMIDHPIVGQVRVTSNAAAQATYSQPAGSLGDLNWSEFAYINYDASSSGTNAAIEGSMTFEFLDGPIDTGKTRLFFSSNGLAAASSYTVNGGPQYLGDFPPFLEGTGTRTPVGPDSVRINGAGFNHDSDLFELTNTSISTIEVGINQIRGDGAGFTIGASPACDTAANECALTLRSWETGGGVGNVSSGVSISSAPTEILLGTFNENLLVNYQDSTLYGNLALGQNTGGDGDLPRVQMSRSGSLTGTVTVTLIEAATDPTFFFEDADFQNASITVPAGFTSSFVSAGGTLTGSTVTVSGAGNDANVSGAFQYDGVHPAGTSFAFNLDWTSIDASRTSENIAFGMSAGSAAEHCDKSSAETVPSRTIINDNFNSQKSSDILNFKGVARYAGDSSNGYITLVGAGRDLKGTVILDSHQERALDFNFSTHYSIKNGNGADGIGIGYGDLSGAAFGEFGERNTRNGLWIVLDTYRGSAGNGELEVWYNKKMLYKLSLPSSALRGNFRDLDLKMRHSGTTGILTLEHSSSLIGKRTITIPNWNPQSDWRWGIGARTGARFDWHVIEDLKITDVTGSARPEMQLSVDGAGFLRDDEEGASWTWSASDINGDLQEVKLLLRNESGDVVRTESKTSGFRRDGGTTSGTFQWLPSDGLGEFTLEMVAYDRYGCAHTTATPVSVVDDDAEAPELSVFYGAGNLPFSDPITDSHGQTNSFSWVASDSETGGSGISRVFLEIYRDGELFNTVTGAASGTLLMDSYGIGEFDIVATAFDNDFDRSSMDQSATTVSRRLTITNDAPKVEIGNGRFAIEGRPSTFSVQGVVDPDGETPSYSWDFGDGNILTGESVSFAFPDQGIYPVSVTATDKFGAIGTDSLSVQVNNADPVIESVVVTGETPTDFSVQATDVASDVLTYEYDFTSDGTIDYIGGPQASHSYLESGLYVATIYVRDEGGGVATTFASVPIGVDLATLPEVNFGSLETVLDEGAESSRITVTLAAPFSVSVAVPLVVSGTASLLDYELSDSVLTFPAGTTSTSFQVRALDDGIDESETETLDLKLLGVSSTQDTHAVTIQDNDAQPRVRMSLASQAIDEDAGPVLVTAELDRASGLDVIIPLQFSGTAVKGSDWEGGLTAEEIVIPAGQLSGSYALEVLPDDIPEGNETIIAQLVVPVNAVSDDSPGSWTAATLTIPFNDAPRVQWTTINKTVSESSGALELIARLSSASTLPVTVDWSLIGGSATVGDDFSSQTSGTLTFAPGQTEQTLSIQVIDDSVTENQENLAFELSNPTNAILGEPLRAITTIVDNDRKVSFTESRLAVWEDVGFVEVTAQISEPSTESVIVPLTVRSATAVEGEDFALDQDFIVISPGELTGSVQIPIVNDLENEEFREELQVVLQQPSNATLDLSPYQQEESLAVIIRDDDPFVNFQTNVRYLRESFGTAYVSMELSAPTNKEVTIPLSFSGSLDLGSDVTFDTPAKITIPAGELSGEIAVHVIDDGFKDALRVESMLFRITKPVNALSPEGIVRFYKYYEVPAPTDEDPFRTRLERFLGGSYRNELLLNVLDNDVQLQATLSPEAAIRSENSGTVSVEVELIGGTAPEDIVIPFVTSGTAKHSVDYEISQSQIVVPKGSAKGKIEIEILNDTKRENRESVKLRLLEPIVSEAGINLGRLFFRRSDTFVLAIVDDDQPTTLSSPRDELGYNGEQLEIDPNFFELPPGLKNAKVSGSSSNDTVYADKLQIGLTADGYISGSTVFFDANRNSIIDFLDLNNNGLQDTGEPSEPFATTFVDGTFAFEIPPEFDRNDDGVFSYEEGRFVGIGGIDASTGLPLEVALTGPAETPAVTPLSTVLDHMLVNSADPAATLTRLLDAFDLADPEFLYTNTIWDAYQGKAEPQKVQRINAILHNSAVVISKTAAALDGAPPIAWLGERTYEAFAAAITSPNAELDLSEPFVIDSLLRTVLDQAGLTASDEHIFAASESLARVNAQIASTDATSGLEFLTEVAKAQAVAQGDLADDFAAVFAGEATLSQVIPSYSADSIASTIAAKPARDVLPPAVAINDVRHVEGDSGQTFAELTVVLFQPSKDPVSVRYRTIDSTAEAGVDYEPIDDVLQWAAGDTSDRKILIPINGDTDFEGDERVLVELYEPVNSVIRRDLGTVTVAEQDSLQYQVPSGLAAAELSLFYQDNQILLIQNDEIVIDVEVDSPRSIRIVGAEDQPTELVVNLGSDRAAIAGGLTFHGQTQSDQLRVNNALEESFEHIVGSGTSGRLNLADGFIVYSGVNQYVDDVSPSIDVAPAALIEGVTQTFSASSLINTEEFATTFAWKVTGDAGQILANGSAGEDFTWTPDDNGMYRVELTAVSAQRGEYRTSIPLSIANAQVDFDAGPDIALVPDDEGILSRSGISFTDPGDDQWSGTVEYGDGTGEQILSIDAVNKTFDLNHRFTTEGTYLVLVQIKDDDSDFVKDTFTVSVDLNSPPVARDDVLIVSEDSQAVDLTGVLGDGGFGLLGNDEDPDGDALTIAAIDGSTITKGVLQLSSGVVTFDPQGEFEALPAGEKLTQAFTYTVVDPSGETSSATAAIEVIGVNDAPIVSVDVAAITIREGTTASNNGSFGDIDAGDTVVLESSLGDITDAGNGKWGWSYDGEDDLAETDVIIRATDQHGAAFETTFSLSVTNDAPELSNVQLNSWSKSVLLQFDVKDSSLLDTHTATIDWGNGQQTTLDVGLGPQEVTYEYADGGVYPVSLLVSDDDGGSNSADSQAFATGASVRDGVLQVVGTPERDAVLITQLGSRQFVSADFLPGWLRTKTFRHADYGRIEVYVGDGNDWVHAASSLRHDMLLLGGAGNDYLKSAKGDDILIGGSGDDILNGQQGDDLMIGGRGGDKLLGASGGDLLIAGYTSFDQNVDALLAIHDEWTADRNYHDRRENLLGNEVDSQPFAARLNRDFFLRASGEEQTVFDDESSDYMVGSGGLDWYFASLGEEDDKDRIAGSKKSELVELLE